MNLCRIQSMDSRWNDLWNDHGTDMELGWNKYRMTMEYRWNEDGIGIE